MTTTPATPTPVSVTRTAAPARVVPLAIWPVAQTSPRYQRAGRYHPDCYAQPAKMLPDLARRIIDEYSEPGWTVVDPMAGIGTTVVQAALAGRRGIGLELDARWATMADTNLDHMLQPDRRRLAEVTVGDARRLPDILSGVAGRVDLVVTSPPYPGDAAIIDRAGHRAGGQTRRGETTYNSTDRANLGHTPRPVSETAMTEIYAACYRVLRPGGRLVVVTENTRRHGRMTDVAALTVRLAQAAGFNYLQHVIALHAAIRNGGLAAPSYGPATNGRHPRRGGEAAQLVVHQDVTVFQRSELPDAH